MKLSDFDYDLPEELIAQRPSDRREDSRLLVVDRRTESFSTARFAELPTFLDRDDLLVLNNTKVFPARLRGEKVGSGGRVEVLLIRELSSELWECLLRPGGRCPAGTELEFGEGLRATVENSRGDLKRKIRFRPVEDLWSRFEILGEMPLPPYIRRPRGPDPHDRLRYQTVFAEVEGSVAAPTAGLHFTKSMLERIPHCFLTLHVGYGTFAPVRSEIVEEHEMGTEFYSIARETADRIESHRQEKGRIVAVGTTTTRALEDVAGRYERVVSGEHSSNLFIYPGFEFQVVEGLVTNFHLPKSTLLLLVSALAGKRLILEAYKFAVKERFRFYSYGDAMLIR